MKIVKSKKSVSVVRKENSSLVAELDSLFDDIKTKRYNLDLNEAQLVLLKKIFLGAGNLNQIENLKILFDELNLLIDSTLVDSINSITNLSFSEKSIKSLNIILSNYTYSNVFDGIFYKEISKTIYDDVLQPINKSISDLHKKTYDLNLEYAASEQGISTSEYMKMLVHETES